jgi:two-component system, NarL family, sensor kinase
MKCLLPYLLFLLFIASLLYCTPQPSSGLPVKNSRSPTPLDSIGSWLNTPDHYLEPNFHTVFNQSFQQQIQEGRIDSAAHLLFLAGQTACTNYVFDSLLVRTSLQFVGQYEKQIPDAFRVGILSNLGNFYASVSEYSTSNLYLHKSINIIAKDDKTRLNIASAKNYLMYNYQNTGNIDSAILIGYEALETFKEMGNITGQLAVYTNLSGAYKYLSDYQEAIKFNDLAMEIALQDKDSINFFINYIDKISLYEEISHPNYLPLIDSFYHFYKAWNPKSSNNQLAAQSIYAHKLVIENKLTEAKKILDESAPIYEKVTDEYFKQDYLIALAAYELKKGGGMSNPSLFKDQLLLLEASQDFHNMIMFNSVLCEDALLRHDYKNAYYYNNASVAARDSLREQQIRDKVKELDKKYQTEKKEQLIVLQNIQLEQKNTFIGFLISSLAGLLLLVLTGYLWQRQKRTQREANIQQQFTQQLFENTEDERSRIARDLHDGVSHELLTLKRSISFNQEDTAQRIDHIINDIRQISRNLHPVMLESIGLKLSLETLCDQYMESGELFITYDITYDKRLTNTAELQVFRIVQEALSNTIKYAHANAAKLTITPTHSDTLQVMIEDNGTGFDVERILSSGKSFGLNSILQRSKAIGAIASIKSSEQGTIISVLINLI